MGTWYRWPHHDLEPLDVRDVDSVDDLIADYQPDVTFLTASAGCAEWAEANPAESHDVAVEGTQTVASAVARNGGSLVYFSSDDVFGDYRTVRREDDAVAPQSVAAAHRASAETIVRRTLPDSHLVLRTGWIYGPDERSRGWTNQLLRQFADEEPVLAASDNRGQPTYGPDLAEVALDLVRAGQTGTLHVVGPDTHTEYSFARIAAFLFGADVDRIEECRSEDVGTIRAMRAGLDRLKLRQLVGPRAIRGVTEGLRALRAETANRSGVWVRTAA